MTVIALGITAWIGLRILSPSLWFPLDDAYITLHSAQVMHWGADPNFVGASPLLGATSAPFLVLVYLLLFLLPPVTALFTACWFGAIIYALGLVRIAYVFRLRPIYSAAVVVVGLLTSFVPFQLINGLETSWVLACVAWALALASEEKRNWAALVAGAAAALRPEFALYAALFSAALAWEDRSARSLAKYLLICAVPVIPGAIWYLHATGMPFSVTAEAKRYFYADAALPITGRLGEESIDIASFLLICGISTSALFFLEDSALAKANTAFLVLIFVIAFFSEPGGLGWNGFRYLIPVVPMMTWNLARLTHSRPNLSYLLGWSVIFSIAMLPKPVSAYRMGRTAARNEQNGVAVWANRNLPSNAIVMVHDAGYLSYATRFRMVDMVGLKTPVAVELNRTLTWANPKQGHTPVIAKLAIEAGASYLVTLHGWCDMDDVPGQLRNQHWSVDLLDTSGGYRIYHIAPPVETAAH